MKADAPCRPEQLWEATAGLDPGHRLDHGASSSAYKGLLPAGLAGPEQRPVGVRAYDWGAWRALALQTTHASRLADLCHPNLLPLVGVCAESRQFVYDLMPVSTDIMAWTHPDALAVLLQAYAIISACLT